MLEESQQLRLETRRLFEAKGFHPRQPQEEAGPETLNGAHTGCSPQDFLE
jgi:hypothetical protein